MALLLAFFGQTLIPALRDALNARVKRTVGGDGEDTGIYDDLGRRHGRRRHDDNDFGGTWKGD